ncbi:hypothetical protein, partial [Embleya sp. NPDC059259]
VHLPATPRRRSTRAAPTSRQADIVLHTSDPNLNRRFRRHFHVRRDQLVDVSVSSGRHDCTGLLTRLKDILEREPESGTRVLLISFGIDGNGSAGVLEV